MLLAVVALQILLLALVVTLLLRKPAPTVSGDRRLLSLPETFASFGGKLDAMDSALRSNVSELRYEQSKAAHDAHSFADSANTKLREEIASNIERLSKALHEGLGAFRADNSGSADKLRLDVHRELIAIGERLNGFFKDNDQRALDAQKSLHGTLTALADKNGAGHDAFRQTLQERLDALGSDQRHHQELLRASMEHQLGRLNADNTAKLEEMRVTVDEKLQKTLNERLTQSFGQVTTHLGEVQKGLGEMKELANGVSDLKKVFANVKTRGIVGEFQLGMQLEQMFSREQYEKNVAVKPNSAERVEYALKIPQGDTTALFPIDSKFPREVWERLERAYEHGGSEQIATAGNDFERAIRAEAERICKKYIYEPVTLPHAIMFLPTEGLFAEVMRRPALQADLQQKCSVTIAGPSTLMAILTSFRMGFASIAFEKKSSEIRDTLSAVKTEFKNFGGLIEKAETQVTRVQRTLGEITGKTKTIDRRLRGVTEFPDASSTLPGFDEMANVVPLLAAMSGDEEPTA